jgi:hypothetical protein
MERWCTGSRACDTRRYAIVKRAAVQAFAAHDEALKIAQHSYQD